MAEKRVKGAPVAIVGMSCRLPGAPDVAAFWALLQRGEEAIREVPGERFEINAWHSDVPRQPGKIPGRGGGFIDGVDLFDPVFFGISAREAERMDPQQRLLMETTFEALEDAGMPLGRYDGASAGVFVGMCYNEYEDILLRDAERIDLYSLTGGFRSIAANRLSFFFDLRGPSICVDTACSSGLAAVHLAVQSIRSGESSFAVAGAVNLVLDPAFGIGFAQASMLAADSRCKFGDASGDGFVRSEGCGVVVLKPLAKAVEDHDRIYALIRGSASNNDGRSSGAMMTPGDDGQAALLCAAYDDAGVAPAHVQYVECHGPGTRAGDPVELAAIARVLGQGRAASDIIRVGSVKTNLGHTEGAAGMAGLIKTALAIYRRKLPPSLHFREPSPRIAWDAIPIRMQTSLGGWPRPEAPRVAGVSSFGIGGTNFHAVLQQTSPDDLQRSKA